MNIILIGFASSGKSTAAQALSEKTGWPHIDLDRLIESRCRDKHPTQQSCRKLFSLLGPEGFTELETDALNGLSLLDSSILSTGGHAPLSKDNRTILKRLGTIVYLKTDIKTVLIRMREKGFPSSIEGGEQGIEAEWRIRDPIYSRLADFTICNDQLTPEQTAAQIIELLPRNSFQTTVKKEP